MTRRPRLEPCPICSEPPEFDAPIVDHDGKPLIYFVRCPWRNPPDYECHGESFSADLPRDVARQWNAYAKGAVKVSL